LARGLAEAAVVFPPLDRVEKRDQGQGDLAQQPSAFGFVGELIGPYVCGAVNGRLLDDSWVLFVRRDA
jgi:hypothetical protein